MCWVLWSYICSSAYACVKRFRSCVVINVEAEFGRWVSIMKNDIYFANESV